MKRFNITLTGDTALLMHNDNLSWAEYMTAWGKDPANKAKSIAGDDRSPAFRWIGNLYIDRGVVVVPSDNLMTMLREGGKKCPTGKRGATFKTQTQSGIIVDQPSWPVVVNGKTIPYEPIKELIGEEDFSIHEARATELGFELHQKRARINGQSKHVRVRPMFFTWTISGSMTVLDDQISREVLQNILNQGGMMAGLGDWRPSSPKSPGPYGKFTATIE